MVKFYNRLTGSEMFVSEDRIEEYKAAGHKIAVEPEKSKTARKAPVKKVKK